MTLTFPDGRTCDLAWHSGGTVAAVDVPMEWPWSGEAGVPTQAERALAASTGRAWTWTGGCRIGDRAWRLWLEVRP